MERRKLIRLACLLPFVGSRKLFAQEYGVPVTSGGKGPVVWAYYDPGEEFLTGNQFRTYNADEQAMYLMGLWDGFLFSTAFAGDETDVKTLAACLRGWSNQQLLAVVKKYMEEHPENWAHPMNWILWKALPKTCGADVWAKEQGHPPQNCRW